MPFGFAFGQVVIALNTQMTKRQLEYRRRRDAISIEVTEDRDALACLDRRSQLCDGAFHVGKIKWVTQFFDPMVEKRCRA